MNETRQCENAFCSLLVLPWRRVFAPSLPVGEACVGSTAGEGAPGPLERRSELGRHGLAWRAFSARFLKPRIDICRSAAGPSSHRRRVPIIGAAMSEPAAAE